MPSRTVFLDTNGWLALLNASDTQHEPALALWEDLVEEGATLVATDWVLAETGNGLTRGLMAAPGRECERRVCQHDELQ
jgi:predicted nucleic acid-binding protein